MSSKTPRKRAIRQTSDATVGQVLRYMRGVKKEMAEPDDSVEGLVIAHKADEQMRFALSAVSGVDLKLYEVEFRLRAADDLVDTGR